MEEAVASPIDHNVQNCLKRKKKFLKLLVLPYFLGIAWTCLHPIVSVLTGELKCRGWFIDENALEVRFTDPNQQKVPETTSGQYDKQTLCDALNSHTVNLSCHSHGELFQLAMVVPLSNAIDPTDEAIVLVAPAPLSSATWSSSAFHYSLLELIERLADPIATPWLAKTIMVVSPTTSSSDQIKTLEDTVMVFLNALMGSKSSTTSGTASGPPLLPPKFSRPILRNLVVLNIEDRSITATFRNQLKNENNKGQTDFSILPQGKRGALPNMDMVTLIGKIYQRASFLNTNRYPNSTFLAHGYTEESKIASEFIQESSVLEGRNAKTWAKDLSNLGLFVYTMARGPYPPHHPALDRGIDAVTIQTNFQGIYWRDPSVEFVANLENVLRSLSNLHERLHHSFVLYWLPSPDKFISHMEYFLPNILILLPLAIRAFGMILVEDEESKKTTTTLHMGSIGSSVLLTISTMLTMLLMSIVISDEDIFTTNTSLLIYYALVAILWQTTFKSNEKKIANTKKSLQFAACATAAYILVPIAFTHSSLSYVPSMILSPLLAFPYYAGLDKKGEKLLKSLLAGFWILTLPPILLVPRVFDTYTIFVRYGYIPLHVQFLLLLIS